MHEELGLYATLVALYLAECAVWVPRGAVAFVTRGGDAAGLQSERRARLCTPPRSASTPRGGLVLGPLFPGTSGTFVVPQWPVSLDARGVLGWVAECLDADQRVAHSGLCRRHDDIARVESELGAVLVDGEPLLTSASPRLAKRVASAVESLRAGAPDARQEKLESLRASLFDVAAVRARVDAFTRGTAALRGAAMVLAFVLFVAAPALVAIGGLARVWPLALAAIYLPAWVVTALYVRAHQRLTPERDLERWGHAALFALVPISATRAADALARPLLHGFHPFAVAVALLDPESLGRFAAALLRDARHPRHPVCPGDDAEAAEIELAHRVAMRRRIEATARAAGLDPAALLRAPAPEDGSAAFCPRCLAQYRAADGRCEDCGGVPVSPFPAT